MDISINILNNIYNLYTYILWGLLKEAQRALCTLNYSFLLYMSVAGIECHLLTVQREVFILRNRCCVQCLTLPPWP